MDLLFSNRCFLRFFLSRFISRVGDGIHSLALLWLSYRWTKSAAVVALVMVSFSLPAILVSPFAGAAADRRRREAIMVASDLVQAVCTAVLALLAFTGRLNIPLLMLITAAMSVASAYFLPASMSIIPQIVSKEDITRANGLVQISSSFSIVIGPVIGVGLIAAIGVPLAFLANSASFLISAALLTGIKTQPVSLPSAAPSPLATIKDGLSTIRRFPLAFKLLDKAAVINFFFAAVTIVIPVVAESIYRMGSRGIGLMMSSYGLGMFTSSVALGSIKKEASPLKTITFSIAVLGVAFILFGAASSFRLSMLYLFLIGFFLNVANVNILSLWQRSLPNEVLGRIMSFATAISMSLSPVSYAITGVLIELVGVRAVLMAGGVFIILNAMRVLRIKELREAYNG